MRTAWNIFGSLRKLPSTDPPLEQGPVKVKSGTGTCFSPLLATLDLAHFCTNRSIQPAIQGCEFLSGRNAVEINSLRELYVEHLRDLYDAENQLIKALPKMAKEASSDELRQGIEEHLEQTRGQAERLEQIFEQLGERPKGKKCKGMQGLIEEGQETLDEDMEEDTKDAAIIAAAQRVEHYEISGYGTARTYANLLGENEAAELLEETLNEERETDQKLTQLAEQINVEAAQGEEVEEEEEERPSRARSASSGPRGRRRVA
jgi:ferritin-like metal-binding protein YciE